MICTPRYLLILRKVLVVRRTPHHGCGLGFWNLQNSQSLAVTATILSPWKISQKALKWRLHMAWVAPKLCSMSIGNSRPSLFNACHNSVSQVVRQFCSRNAVQVSIGMPLERSMDEYARPNIMRCILEPLISAYRSIFWYE
jgi:hypothetical protein